MAPATRNTTQLAVAVENPTIEIGKKEMELLGGKCAQVAATTILYVSHAGRHFAMMNITEMDVVLDVKKRKREQSLSKDITQEETTEFAFTPTKSKHSISELNWRLIPMALKIERTPLKNSISFQTTNSFFGWRKTGVFIVGLKLSHNLALCAIIGTVFPGRKYPA